MVARYFFTTMVVLFLCSWSAPVNAQMVATSEDAARIVTVRNVQEKDHAISGEVVNKSPHMIRNVTLLIQYHWLWKNEFKPGNNPPGRAVYVELNREISPGASMHFTYEPQPPLPDRKDGYFSHEVSVAGFTTVIQP